MKNHILTYAEHKAKILDAYSRRSHILFAYDVAGNSAGRAGNSWAAIFWAGFDGMTWGVRVPRRSDKLSFAWYAAGRAAAKKKL